MDGVVVVADQHVKANSLACQSVHGEYDASAAIINIHGGSFNTRTSHASSQANIDERSNANLSPCPSCHSSPPAAAAAAAPIYDAYMKH